MINKNIPQRGIFSAQMMEEKMNKNHGLNTYMCWKMIKMKLETITLDLDFEFAQEHGVFEEDS